jgi:hypothetical protein
VRWPAGVFLLGGAGRLLSLAVSRPAAMLFQLALAAIELALPLVFFRLADAEERTRRNPGNATPAER